MRTFSFTETREDQCEALVCFQQSRRLFGRVDLIRCAIIALVVLIALFGYNNFGTGASYESNGVSRPLIARALVLFVLLLPSWLLGMLGVVVWRRWELEWAKGRVGTSKSSLWGSVTVGFDREWFQIDRPGWFSRARWEWVDRVDCLGDRGWVIGSGNKFLFSMKVDRPVARDFFLSFQNEFEAHQDGLAGEVGSLAPKQKAKKVNGSG